MKNHIQEQATQKEELHKQKMAKPQATRASARIQDNGQSILEKAIARKAGLDSKGTIPTNSKSHYASSNHVDIVSRACGINMVMMITSEQPIFL